MLCRLPLSSLIDIDKAIQINEEKGKEKEDRDFIDATILTVFTRISCKVKKIELAFLPCTHMYSCQDCFIKNKISKCIGCNSIVKKACVVYFS